MVTNKEKIIKVLEEKGEVSAGDLANMISVSQTNISKYLNPLLDERKIRRVYKQIGKSRYAYYSLYSRKETISNTDSNFKHILILLDKLYSFMLEKTDLAKGKEFTKTDEEMIKDIEEVLEK